MTIASSGTTTIAPSSAPEADVQDFADMSAALTGFLSSVLKPALDPVGLARTYYEFALTQVGVSAMSALMSAFRAIQTQPPQVIADTLLETSNSTPSDQAKIAQSIVAMWYLGAWYRPGQTGGGGFPPRRCRSFLPKPTPTDWCGRLCNRIRWASAPSHSATGVSSQGRCRVSA